MSSMEHEDEVMEEGEDVEEGENTGNGKLECDFSAYKLFHEGSTGAPCLSFDIVPDKLGEGRTCETPICLTFVAGTQASRTHLNSITLMKMRNLVKIKQDTDSDSESESELDDDEDEGTPRGQPIVSSASVSHAGCVNRIRVTDINGVTLAGAWSETGHVGIWDMSSLMDAVDAPEAPESIAMEQRPMFTFKGHRSEGFALDWSKSMPGTLATGDCQRNIYIWKPVEGGSWAIDPRPYESHTASVEDIQWSPNEPNVFASCSVDKTLRIWDARAAPKKACMITVTDAHESDINVIHWNHNEPFIVSGGDDGKVKVWDLRTLQNGSSVAVLKQHTGPVTTVEWHPDEASVLASGAEDNQVLQWDLAVEKDTDVDAPQDDDVPDQLLFVHQGQEEVKELHWHKQIPGLIITTAHSGFNIFKTISC